FYRHFVLPVFFRARPLRGRFLKRFFSGECIFFGLAIGLVFAFKTAACVLAVFIESFFLVEGFFVEILVLCVARFSFGKTGFLFPFGKTFFGEWFFSASYFLTFFSVGEFLRKGLFRAFFFPAGRKRRTLFFAKILSGKGF